MLDSVRILEDVASLNSFSVAKSVNIHANSYPVDFYIRLFQSKASRRYIPATGAKVQVEFMRNDSLLSNSSNLIKYLSKPFTADSSIWSCSLTKADIAKITTGGFRVTVTEGSKVTAVYSGSVIIKLPNSDSGAC
jgi:hypothetical protein